MLFDPHILVESPLHILAVIAIIMVGKTLAAMALVLFFRLIGLKKHQVSPK
jgi:CPA2 family monovalent cation:H+ antiporter-2